MPQRNASDCKCTVADAKTVKISRGKDRERRTEAEKKPRRREKKALGNNGEKTLKRIERNSPFKECRYAPNLDVP